MKMSLFGLVLADTTKVFTPRFSPGYAQRTCVSVGMLTDRTLRGHSVVESWEAHDQLFGERLK